MADEIAPAARRNVAIYRTDTGAIVRIVQCRYADVANQAAVGEAALDFTGQPAPTFLGHGVVDGAIVARTPPIEALRSIKTADLSASCSSAIRGGFTSSALGSAQTYPSAETDQRNLAQAALVGGYLWCSTSGAWSLAAHTAAQAQAVLADFSTFRDSQRTNLAALLARVGTAADQGALDAISW